MATIPDAVLLLSFGGPESREEVMPFLETVLRGRPVPRERLLAVAHHYYHFNGCSPINQQNRDFRAALGEHLNVPVYWGNRNWHPFLADTLRQMRADGVRRAVVYATSAFGSYSGCRQYLEDMDHARAEVGDGAPELEKMPPFSAAPGFVECVAERVRESLAALPEERRDSAALVFTAHSIPVTMSDGSPYVAQIETAAAAVARILRRSSFALAYQSRSGPPGQPWLEPDIAAALAALEPGTDVVVCPIGFVSDHMEVVWDLDVEARQIAESRGLRMLRAATPGTHPLFVSTIAGLIQSRLAGGELVACAANCCPPPKGRP